MLEIRKVLRRELSKHLNSILLLPQSVSKKQKKSILLLMLTRKVTLLHGKDTSQVRRMPRQANLYTRLLTMLKKDTGSIMRRKV